MSDINRVTLTGILASAPEVRYTNNGSAVCSVRIKSTESFTAKGEHKSFDSYHGVVVWGQLGERIGQALSEGDPVLVEGQLKTRSYEAGGEKKWITEVVVREFGGTFRPLRGRGQQQQPPPQQQPQRPPQQPPQRQAPQESYQAPQGFDDDIPFSNVPF